MSATFKGRELPYWRRHDAEELFFALIRPDGTLDARLVPANYRSADRLYVLDVPPGRYAPVAASYFTGRSRQLAKFDDALSRKWAVEVHPGQIVFAGAAFLFRFADGWAEPALNVVARTASYLPPFRRATIPIRFDSPRLVHNAAAEIDTLRLAREDLHGTFWSEAVAARLRVLGNPPPELTQGFLRKTPMPRRRTDAFSYIDTLDWGEPQRVAGGLQWQAPKTQAWISVIFLPGGSDPARVLGLTLRELREAGAPEDSHTLTEVTLSSRTAYSGLFTSYIYPEASLVGSKVHVFKTRTIIVPAESGAYKAQYRAAAAEFENYRAAFEQFLWYMDFTPPAKEKS